MNPVTSPSQTISLFETLPTTISELFFQANYKLCPKIQQIWDGNIQQLTNGNIISGMKCNPADLSSAIDSFTPTNDGCKVFMHDLNPERTFTADLNINGITITRRSEGMVTTFKKIGENGLSIARRTEASSINSDEKDPDAWSFSLVKSEKGTFALNFVGNSVELSGECVPGTNTLTCNSLSSMHSTLGMRIEAELKKSTDNQSVTRTRIDFKGKSNIPFMSDKDLGFLEFSSDMSKIEEMFVGTFKDFWGDKLMDVDFKYNSDPIGEPKSTTKGHLDAQLSIKVPNKFEESLTAVYNEKFADGIYKVQANGGWKSIVEPAVCDEKQQVSERHIEADVSLAQTALKVQVTSALKSDGLTSSQCFYNLGFDPRKVLPLIFHKKTG